MKRILYLVAGIFIGAFVVAVLNAAKVEVPDAVKASPQFYTVRYESDRVRVVEYRLKPGQREPMHTHRPGVTYIVSSAKIRTTLPTGAVQEGMLQAGDVHGRETSVTHATENVGNTEAHAIIMEFKDSVR